MGNQRTFASLAWNGKGKVTRRERFLAEMDAVIPWSRLIRLIEEAVTVVKRRLNTYIVRTGNPAWRHQIDRAIAPIGEGGDEEPTTPKNRKGRCCWHFDSHTTLESRAKGARQPLTCGVCSSRQPLIR
jgi:hypothetical protein